MTSINSVRKDLVILGKKVKSRRRDLNISQEEFSAIAGLHRTYISQLELGLRNPTYTTLVKIADALKINMTELLDTKI